MCPDPWSMVNAFATIASALFALFGLTLVAYQLHLSRLTATADLLLRLEAEWIDHYSHTYYKVLFNTRHGDTDSINFKYEETAALEVYLNFFATVGVLVERKMLDLPLIDGAFFHRFFHVFNCAHARHIIKQDEAGWSDLLKLQSSWTAYRKAKKPSIVYR